MHTSLLEINEDECVKCHVKTHLSFKPLVNHLEDRLKTEHPIKAQFYKFLLDKLETLKQSDYIIDLEEIDSYSELMVLIYTILTPLAESEKDFFWAMSTPVPDKIFFSTDAFYDFYTDHKLHKKSIVGINDQTLEHKQLQFIYQLILKKFYNFSSVFKDTKVVTYTDSETNLSRYYSIHADTRFIDITLNGTLPPLDFETLGTQMQEGNEIELLSELLPLHNFVLEGFTIITLTDITLTRAIHNIRNILVDHTYDLEAYPQIINSLKTLAGNDDIHFGMMPFLTVNDHVIIDAEQCSQSVLLQTGHKVGMSDDVFYSIVENYRKNPKPIFYSNITDDKVVDNPFLQAVRQSGIYSYTLLPIYHNKKLAGVLEIYAFKELVIDEVLLSKLKNAIPLLAQLFQYSIDAFNARLDAVLKDKFTSLQPSVQWKFNEVAYKYLAANKNEGAMVPIDTVTFQDTYPLFGAIDIRNSTVERNVALKEDLTNLLNELTDALTNIKELIELSLLDKLIFNVSEWRVRISEYITTNDEIMLNSFLSNEVDPLLKHIKGSNPETAPIIKKYYEAVDEETGIGYNKRRELEAAMQLINSSVSRYLEKAQYALQKSYPCYFSKFRTDGVEYDIYIGQSIAPDRPFNQMYLKNLRLWQVRSMAEIARLTRKLAGKMHKPLFTTQLIFIHSHPINISFRNDERRFDVEGAYNIRYEMVKKRIDKVLIKGRTERLTQPDKIAMVYFNVDEAQEYLQYVQYLQEQDYLTPDVEDLELEELQGVSGLRALRVTVKHLADESTGA